MIVGFACLSLTVTTQKANACSHWTPCYVLIQLLCKQIKRALPIYCEHQPLKP